MTLTGLRLQQTARRAAEALPGSGSSRPFTEKLDVHKVGGKVFLIVTDDPGERIITVKAEPERGRRLRDAYPSITAGRYLAKTHWVSVGAGPGITAALVEELVTDSYDLVLDSVPPGRRPARTT
ncbi:MmcQ/YjbR family DNA-binding protein [Streptomyces sp. NPDC001544]|uniref:MmcQ/YjbR family DNA-binding protein n=1 Tax=Streptomyces sp. NPDC001544 TaxID=3364584 RepID=UPI0036D13B3C